MWGRYRYTSSGSSCWSPWQPRKAGTGNEAAQVARKFSAENLSHTVRLYDVQHGQPRWASRRVSASRPLLGDHDARRRAWNSQAWCWEIADWVVLLLTKVLNSHMNPSNVELGRVMSTCADWKRFLAHLNLKESFIGLIKLPDVWFQVPHTM